MKLLVVPLVMLVACAMKPQPTDPPRMAMTQRDIQGLALSQEVVARISHLMRRGIREQIEPAACVASYRIGSDNGHPTVDVYALALADVDSADEVNVWYHGPHLCNDTMPSLHGHVSRKWIIPNPSPVDSATLQRFQAPFGLIVYRLDNDSTVGVTLYWRKP